MIVVYLGPSLPQERACSVLDADYRPPVSRGDIRDAIGDGASIIGIIDGNFYNQTAVAHKEIIEALKRGITVVGGSSMGALRAAELDAFGMIGAGRIYECYRSGKIQADDEVAVTYNPVTGDQMSEPMVNIRYQLKAAECDGILTSGERNSLTGMIAGMYYPERQYPEILRLAVKRGILTEEKAAGISDYIARNPLNLKAEDAVVTLEKIKYLVAP